MRVAWVCLVIVSVGILGFGVITVLPAVAGGNLLIVANGLASIGLGLFGGLIVLIPFRRGERWAWSVLWFYPVFWVVHLVAELPPGQGPHPPDCVHRALRGRSATTRSRHDRSGSTACPAHPVWHLMGLAPDGDP